MEQWYRGWISLETAPADEPCVQVEPGGRYDYDTARSDAKRHIELIRKAVGPEPKGVRFRIHSNSHDYGSYLSIEVDIKEDDEEALEYVERLERDGPTTWTDSL